MSNGYKKHSFFLVLLACIMAAGCSCSPKVNVLLNSGMDTEKTVTIIPFAMNGCCWQARIPLLDGKTQSAINIDSSAILNATRIARHDWSMAIAVGLEAELELANIKINKEWAVKLFGENWQFEIKKDENQKQVIWYSDLLLKGVGEIAFPQTVPLLINAQFSPTRELCRVVAIKEALSYFAIESINQGDCVRYGISTIEGTGLAIETYIKVLSSLDAKSIKTLVDKFDTDYLITGELLEYTKNTCVFIVYCVSKEGAIQFCAAAKANNHNLKAICKQLTIEIIAKSCPVPK